MTDTVAPILYRSICLVLTVWDLPCEGVTFYLLTGEGKEWTEEFSATKGKRRDRFHAGESLQTSSSDHVQNHGLGIIVSVIYALLS